MNEPDTYERIGAAAGFTAIIVSASKLGFFRWMRERWNRPTERAMMRQTLQELAKGFKEIVTSVTAMSGNMATMSNNFIIAEAMTRAIADRDPTPMFQSELPSGRCVWTNKALQRMFGRTKEQMLGFGWAEAIVPEFQERVLHHWRNALVNSDIYNADFPIESDGKIINVRAHADFVTDGEDHKIMAIGSVKLMPVFEKAA